ncbi:unnamed protein product [Darwinula stevensoni]|uniref:Poly [ADP-ribose] polymerase n=1 Tax=Darwinula stevensoni TaxID=69355 RepID=A0A7R9ABV8_9CRUS|nr:unnamed protein product [Darwinula stevensoni]CAG0899731.1 unnamed protein product [Darwinula stevensoni]
MGDVFNVDGDELLRSLSANDVFTIHEERSIREENDLTKRFDKIFVTLFRKVPEVTYDAFLKSLRDIRREDVANFLEETARGENYESEDESPSREAISTQKSQKKRKGDAALGSGAPAAKKRTKKGCTSVDCTDAAQGASKRFTPSGPHGNHKGTELIPLSQNDKDFKKVEKMMQATIQNHGYGFQFENYKIVKIEKIENGVLWKKYDEKKKELSERNSGLFNEKELFHGSPNVVDIAHVGFDERHSVDGMFGRGIYFAEDSSKSNKYVFPRGWSCQKHNSKKIQRRCCYECERKMLLCKVILGKSKNMIKKLRKDEALAGYDSITGRAAKDGLNYEEYVVQRGEQAYPEYLITYTIVKPY